MSYEDERIWEYALFDPFHVTGLFLCPLKTSENLWMFAGGIKRDQWYELGQEEHILVFSNFILMHFYISLIVAVLMLIQVYICLNRYCQFTVKSFMWI